MRHKYSAVRVERDGFSFDSQAEGRYYDYLKAQQASGEVVGFTRQVPLHFPGGVKLVVDFQVFYADGTHRFVEVKGFETESYRAKLRMFEVAYPWATLEVVKA
jgi:hypothetical protein